MKFKDVVCDSCKEAFVIKAKERKHGQGIVETYFACSHCNKEYRVSITDQRCRKLQLKIQRESSKIPLKNHKDPDAYKQLYEERNNRINSLKAELKERMMELKVQYSRGDMG